MSRWMPVAGSAILALATQLALAGELATLHTMDSGQPGPRLSIIVPAPPADRPRTHGLDDQLATLKPAVGVVEVLAYSSPADRTEWLDALAATTAEPGQRLAVVVSTDLAPTEKEEKLRLPLLSAHDGEQARRLAAAAIAPSYGDKPFELSLTPIVGDGPRVIRLDFATGDTTTSRVNRWTRRLVAGLMVETGQLTDTATADAATLAALAAPRPSYAMYDCEGVGGRGPWSVERVLNHEAFDMHVTWVSPEDIREGALGQFDGLMVPGGGGKTIATALQPKGQEIVRQFVAAGGGYTGICAGAYLATCRIDGYLNMAGLYHGQPWRKGGGMVKVELTPEGEAIVGSEFKNFETRYNNGPIFGHEEGLVPQGEFAETVTLAHFRSATNNPDGQPSTEMIDKPAFTATTYGKGRLMLISPHPETHPELDLLSGRAYVWALGLDPQTQEPVTEAAKQRAALGQ